MALTLVSFLGSILALPSQRPEFLSLFGMDLTLSGRAASIRFMEVYKNQRTNSLLSNEKIQLSRELKSSSQPISALSPWRQVIFEAI